MFQSHFHNPTIQANIRDAKEEEYQEGFVRDLFVNILGYTLKPQPNYNFVLEKKTETDATKSDGALLRDDTLIGVVELKDTGTTELDKIEKQVFGYKHKHKNCVYVITSNFEKLRFYINDATDYEEFNLFTLTAERFAVLYLCLQQQHIQNDVPLKMKQASISEEENVTKKLYADYSWFKKQLFANIVELNPQYHKLDLFKKTQKLLDRLLFILFAEDRLLLPPNSVREILKQWQQLKELDNYVSLYSRFIKYFGYLNTGHVGNQYEIFAYNGGLFAPDEILDNIKIDDNLLYSGGIALSKYDFNSEVDVNILGHIFEHSLGEIEEVQAQLEGTEVDKTKTKRKKDGVFYTPRYITKYMVENTVGELCRQQKESMGIADDAFTPQKRKANTKQLQQKLDDYRHWLLHITICDPACGSGAFLNQALEFLIAEHRLVDELTAKLFGDAMVLSDVETTILENNIFGVDINDEAVEIARLSLWLRTARKGRKLNNLSENIKCGNSLIDDTAIAGPKAFNWQQEFKQVFDKGGSSNEASAKSGFDVVIGNPPYVLIQPNNTPIADLNYYKANFDFADFKIDLFHLFFQLGYKICKQDGLTSYIAPSTLLYNYYVENLRMWLLKNNEIKLLAVSSEKVFEDADVHTAIYLFKKTYKIPEDSQINLTVNLESVINGIDDYKYIKREDFNKAPGNVWNLLINSENTIILSKISANKKLFDLSKINRGLITGDRDKYFSKEKVNEKYIKILTGTDVSRYYSTEPVEFVLFEKPKTSGGCWDKEVHLAKHKICVRQIGFQPTASFINEPFAVTGNIFTIITDDEIFEKYILTILNSSVIKYYWQIMFNDFKSSFPQVTIFSLGQVPIPVIPKAKQLPFIAKADIMLSKNKELQQVKQQLQQLLLGKYSGLTLSKKLTDWPALSFTNFLKELGKQKIKLTLPEEAEWLKYFEDQKTIASNIQQVINTTDKEIDNMVYELYELTEEEVRIVEGVV